MNSQSVCFGTGQTWASILVLTLNQLCDLSESSAHSGPVFSYAEDTVQWDGRPGVGIQRGGIFNALNTH